MPAWRARTAPDRDGSITKHAVSGPMKTHSHHFAGPSPSRGANTRHVVSSACRCQEPRDRSVTASASGTSSAPACAHVPAKVAGEISAPCRDRPVTSEFMLRPATTVRRHPDDDPPVQQLRDMITAQPRERRPALRAAVPAALKVPDHLNPGQVRVIPPPRPRPRPPRPALTTTRAAGRRLPATLTPGCRRLRPRPLRRIPEHHPLQDRQRGAHPLKLSRLPRDLGITPRQGLPQLCGGPLPALVRLQRRSQGSPQRHNLSIRTRRDRHAAQQTPSPAANHAPHASVPPYTHPWRRETPSPDFRILTIELACRGW